MSLEDDDLDILPVVVFVLLSVPEVVQRSKVSSQTKAQEFNTYKMARKRRPPQRRVVFDTLGFVMMSVEGLMQ